MSHHLSLLAPPLAMYAGFLLGSTKTIFARPWHHPVYLLCATLSAAAALSPFVK